MLEEAVWGVFSKAGEVSYVSRVRHSGVCTVRKAVRQSGCARCGRLSEERKVVWGVLRPISNPLASSVRQCGVCYAQSKSPRKLSEAVWRMLSKAV
eukprot:1160401-Pelagomonas_calceolata.AAC.4